MTHEQIEHNKKVSDEFTKKISQLSPWFEEPYMKKHIMHIISLLHCFAMKMYSSRRKKKILLIKIEHEN